MSNKKVLNAFIFNGERYIHKNDIEVVGGPSDCDWTRWAMLYSIGSQEGKALYRLYCFKQGSNDTIYQFGYDPSVEQYVFGYESDKKLKISGKPAVADTNTFAMLHDGEHYRMYFLDVNNPKVLHQFVYDYKKNVYMVESSNPTIEFADLPNNVDLRKAAMLYAVGNNQPGYHFYTVEQGEYKELIQAYYNKKANKYERVNNVGINVDPSVSDPSSFSMLNDNEGTYWCYFLKWDNQLA